MSGRAAEVGMDGGLAVRGGGLAVRGGGSAVRGGGSMSGEKCQPIAVSGNGGGSMDTRKSQPIAMSGMGRGRKKQALTFDENVLREELLRDARAIRMPEGAAEAIAERVIKQVEKWATQRSAVTVDDVNRRIAREVEKYSADLAYVYQNRGKII